MTFYRLLLSFKGTRFLGWQKQKDFSPTVQDELEFALRKVFKSDSIKTVGSGRTDTGVHSLAHVVKATAPFAIEPASLERALNSNLPDDIRVLDAQFCSEEFRPTNDALRREYRYLFTNNRTASPFQKDFIANYPFPLDFELMRNACALFVGEWNFETFSCKGSSPSSTIRTIYECELNVNLRPELQGVLPEYHCIRINGSGFLKQMARLMVGSIWHVGRGKLSLEELERALKEGSGRRVGEVAPAEGLYKTGVWY